jgi:hypothetical protein
MTATTDDEKIARLLGEGGEAGRARYGLYWMVNEIIAAQMEGPDPSCSVCYPVSVWARKVVTRPSLLFSTLSTLAVTGVVTVEWDGSDIRVTNRNLLKYRDEYARKSGQTPDNIPARTEGEQKQKEKEKVPLASTANAVPASKGKLLGTLPLNDGSEWEIYVSDVDELQPLYPAVDVRQELRSMKGWLIGNPKLRKTRRGIRRFISSWLEGEQDKAKAGGIIGKPTIHDSISAKKAVLDARAARRMADDPDSNGGGDETGLACAGAGGERPHAGFVC